MKIRHLFFVLAMAIMALASCTEEEQPPIVSYVFTDVSVEAGQTSATITCRNESIDDDKVHASVLLSKNENIIDANKYSLRLQNDTLRGTISGLEQNTMYFFCFEVYTANEHKRTDEVHHFQTTGGGEVTVITLDAINVTQTTATGGGSITTDDNHTVSLRGICWDTVPNPNALQSPHLVSGEGMGTFLVDITGLVSGMTYYMKAYAMCNDVVYYGNQVTFKTSSSQAATVTTGEVTNIAQTSAMGSGEVTDDGGAAVTKRGVCWSTGHNPTTSDSHADSGTAGTGAFTATMTGLTPNTKYYVRAFAKNEKGTSYGEEVSFTTTQDLGSPTVTTSAVTNVTQTTAKGYGNVTADGGVTVTERGVCWGTSHNPTTSGSHASSGTGTGSFTVNMTGLSAGTTYYVRAYAKNSVGTAYSEEVSFTTTANKPTVMTGEVTNVTQTTAKGSGNVTDDGGVSVTERGICWSTSHSPTVSGSHAAASSGGTGSYTVNITGLTANTTYYVRAYATNSQGTSYGSEVSFKTTQNTSAPTVTTSQVTNVTQTTAKGGGNVTSDGNATVTERGICWSTGHNPTVSSSHATAGSGGTGSYTVNMTGLTANTTYYVRAYAKNSVGTSYGNEVSFTTSATTPTVTTSQITNITSTTATGGGNVTNSGGANVTARGVCWGTNHNPTVNSSHTTNGTGTGSFTSSITGLMTNTTYYVRAYATNSAGTTYGAEVSFTTQQVPSYTVSVSANPANGGTVTGGSTYQQGQSCTVSATANSGYTFANWSENGNVVSTGANYTFTVNANRTLVANFNAVPSWPNGLLPGLFSVSATQQVQFSQGNLQYQASTNTWRFAAHQYDYIGSDNSNISQTYNGWIDLFGWGTSGYHDTNDPYNVNYQPWSTSTSQVNSSYNYYGYGPSTNMTDPNLTGTSANYDWGVYNPISNGGNTANQWRTLTLAEWEYVFNTRTTTSGIRYAKAKVKNVNGVILLPDNWSASTYSLSSPNSSGASFSSNTITASQWTTLESAGAVFLPAAGGRSGTSVGNVGSFGYYWSASCYYSYSAYYVYFNDSYLLTNHYNNRFLGFSVRLARVAEN